MKSSLYLLLHHFLHQLLISHIRHRDMIAVCMRTVKLLRSAMLWDVMGGVARRSWARNPHAMETSEEFNRTHADGYHITMPYVAEEKLVQKVVKEK